MNTVKVVAPNFIYDVWKDIESFLNASINVSGGDFTLDQLKFSLGRGEQTLLVSVNEDLFNVFDEESISILIEQEIDKISIETESGKIKMIKPDLSTFSSLITKYGVEKVGKANQIELLYQQQKADGTEEFTF